MEDACYICLQSEVTPWESWKCKCAEKPCETCYKEWYTSCASNNVTPFCPMCKEILPLIRKNEKDLDRILEAIKEITKHYYTESNAQENKSFSYETIKTNYYEEWLIDYKYWYNQLPQNNINNTQMQIMYNITKLLTEETTLTVQIVSYLYKEFDNNYKSIEYFRKYLEFCNNNLSIYDNYQPFIYNSISKFAKNLKEFYRVIEYVLEFRDYTDIIVLEDMIDEIFVYTTGHQIEQLILFILKKIVGEMFTNKFIYSESVEIVLQNLFDFRPNYFSSNFMDVLQYYDEYYSFYLILPEIKYFNTYSLKIMDNISQLLVEYNYATVLEFVNRENKGKVSEFWIENFLAYNKNITLEEGDLYEIELGHALKKYSRGNDWVEFIQPLSEHYFGNDYVHDGFF